MHGRLKVKTTAEQQEAKRKEREKKLKLYTGATQKVFQKRKDGEFDDESLEITSQLLSSNPDFYTLWNYRREIFLDLTKNSESQEMQDRYSKELKFLESCLMVNPKSYGSWHHRGWVMDHMPEPDWKREVALCNQYLEYDERNFHCWDYRRIVVSRANVPPADELKFTDTKISSNFSNYSSWHYRSKLLPLLHPDPENKGRVKEDILLQEYELVQNAFFTDPNDQSAWFYQRWLLGRAEKPQDINLLYARREPSRIVAVFAQPVKLSEDGAATSVTVNGSGVSGTWRNSQGAHNHALVWVYLMNNDALSAQGTLEVCLSVDDLGVSRQCTLTADQTEGWCHESTDSVELFTAQLSMEKSGVLTQELESCQQLQELEPDNKWCLLTIILLMRAIDPLKYEAETLRYFETLLQTDPRRAGYFRDLRSKFVIENAITRNMQQQSASREIDLSGKELTTLRHTERMVLMTRVNLSSNQLPSLKGCHTLLCAQTLLADSNSIRDLKDLPSLPCLETLSLKANSIGTVQDLAPLQTSTRLQNLDLRSNPVCDIPDFQQSVKALLPQLTTLNEEKL
ncbi:geranylgeranyl transferase type-2 subunit alpha-like [Patiria miniata]|uniref:Geranylgeranyl transferase type-2 subunit alpha n=1 Tax=Patiria miniata TaxID=46514 RepID=A0A914B356_PATMI|nr:geranylgeranyl transferase type-2 subunit alpha-like [Patiria miniata]